VIRRSVAVIYGFLCLSASGQDLITVVRRAAECEWTGAGCTPGVIAHPDDILEALRLHADKHDANAVRALERNQSGLIRAQYETAAKVLTENSGDKFWKAVVLGNESVPDSCEQARADIRDSVKSEALLASLSNASEAYGKKNEYGALWELLHAVPPGNPAVISAYRLCFAERSPDQLFYYVNHALTN